MHEAARLHDRLTAVAFVVACAALVVLAGAFVVEVVMRYAFSAPTRWSADTASYAMLVVNALALPTVTREHGHVAITAFIERLAPARRLALARVLLWIGTLALAGCAAVLWSIAAAQWRDGIETVAAYAVPKGALTAVAAWGLTDAALHMLRQACSRTPPVPGRELAA